ncbi:polysaccharide pyruvyl transferase family protein [Butyrivibrio sp. XPD2006]|uniref:polysaccharide pyruvyl transferase family protein n=1 Tax=Butyrivibrio sp. XPD2006 TaxID=1280668 RepID=UPI0003B5472C|nr:polysaccharide pyruvyl transferase family protein [Butyrivibrio sp. XPD2006]
MKVGIMSMQRIRNYGSFLQAYGLKGMIESLGHDVEFVDYKVEEPIVFENNQAVSARDPFLKRAVRKAYYKLYDMTPNGKRKKKMLNDKVEYFRTFGEKMFPMLGIGERNERPELDALVIGSDEVFNCLQSNKDVGFSPELFGADNNSKKLMSYAASFGNTTIPRLKEFEKDEEVAGYLKKFDAISVRDKNSIKVVKELTGIDPYYHVDPVLISDFSSKKVNNLGKKDYIIIYAYSSRVTDEEKRVIRQFAKDHNKKLVSIQGYHDFVDEYWPGDPFEVLEYFNEADYIVTDTFHGSIFSIINNKPFVTLVRKTVGNSYGNEEKLSDLLTRFGLQDRIVPSPDKLPEILTTPIDYDKVNAIRDKERQNTLNYLREQLGECK